MTKNEVRSTIKKAIANLSMEQRREEALLCCKKIADNPHFQSAAVVLAFSPLPDEIDIMPIIKEYCQKKTFLLPVVDGNNLVIRHYDATNMHTGAFGILEPEGPNYTKPDSIDLIITPGVAFDKENHRLGRGKGYYDRLLSSPQLKDVHRMGVCFSVQKVSKLPTEAHDIPVDEVI